MKLRFLFYILSLGICVQSCFAACLSNLSFKDDFFIKESIPHFVTIPHGKIEYYRFGNGTPIVLIIGYASTVTGWDIRLLKSLAQHHEVIIFNNRGTGHSKVFSNSYTMSDLGNDTYHLIEKLKLHNTTVVGISMGGMIAQELAAFHPDVVHKLVLINTAIAGKLGIPPNNSIKQVMFKTNQNLFLTYLKVVHYFFPFNWQLRMAVSLVENHFIPYHHNEEDVSVKTILKQQSVLMHWIKDNDTGKKIANLHMPILIMNGYSDVIIPPKNSVILAELLKQASLVRFQGGGHAMIYQYPYEIGFIINKFIQES